jgi:hypothetical protein
VKVTNANSRQKVVVAEIYSHAAWELLVIMQPSLFQRHMMSRAGVEQPLRYVAVEWDTIAIV